VVKISKHLVLPYCYCRLFFAARVSHRPEKIRTINLSFIRCLRVVSVVERRTTSSISGDFLFTFLRHADNNDNKFSTLTTTNAKTSLSPPNSSSSGPVRIANICKLYKRSPENCSFMRCENNNFEFARIYHGVKHIFFILIVLKLMRQIGICCFFLSLEVSFLLFA
jgi:hypothetical protein